MNASPRKSSPASVFLAGAVVVLLSALFACWTFHGAIDPRNLSWMSGDFVTGQFAWEAYRSDPLPALSLTTTHASWPLPLPIAMFDILPFLAALLKSLSAWLPVRFQYFGPLFVANAALQGLFAFLFLREAVAGSEMSRERDIAVFLAALLFAAAPVLYVRFYLQHGSLTEHWLILAALWLYLRSERVGVAWSLAAYAALLLIAGAINPYMAVMTTGVYCAALLRFAIERRLRWTGVVAAAAPFALALGGMILAGFLKLGDDGVLPGEGYGYYSSNLNALINPMTRLLGSSLLPPLPVASAYQYEGYGYLGAGAMIVVLAGLWLGRRRGALYDSSALPLLIVAGGAFLLALSTTLSAGAVAFPLPAPAPLTKLLEIFRSSGRFVWVTDYILLGLGATLLLRLAPPRAALAVLTLAVFVQTVDLAAPYVSLRARFATPRPWRFTSPVFADLGGAHTALIVVPPWQCARKDQGNFGVFEPISWLVIDNHLLTNSFYAGRLPKDQARLHCVEFPQDFAAAPVDPKAAYLFSPGAFAAGGAHVAETHYCDLGDDFILCRADRGRKGLSETARQAIESHAGASAREQDALPSRPADQ